MCPSAACIAHLLLHSLTAPADTSTSKGPQPRTPPLTPPRTDITSLSSHPRPPTYSTMQRSSKGNNLHHHHRLSLPLFHTPDHWFHHNNHHAADGWGVSVDHVDSPPHLFLPPRPPVNSSGTATAGMDHRDRDVNGNVVHGDTLLNVPVADVVARLGVNVTVAHQPHHGSGLSPPPSKQSSTDTSTTSPTSPTGVIAGLGAGGGRARTRPPSPAQDRTPRARSLYDQLPDDEEKPGRDEQDKIEKRKRKSRRSSRLDFDRRSTYTTYSIKDDREDAPLVERERDKDMLGGERRERNKDRDKEKRASWHSLTTWLPPNKRKSLSIGVGAAGTGGPGPASTGADSPKTSPTTTTQIVPDAPRTASPTNIPTPPPGLAVFDQQNQHQQPQKPSPVARMRPPLPNFTDPAPPSANPTPHPSLDVHTEPQPLHVYPPSASSHVPLSDTLLPAGQQTPATTTTAVVASQVSGSLLESPAPPPAPGIVPPAFTLGGGAGWLRQAQIVLSDWSGSLLHKPPATITTPPHPPDPLPPAPATTPSPGATTAGDADASRPVSPSPVSPVSPSAMSSASRPVLARGQAVGSASPAPPSMHDALVSTLTRPLPPSHPPTPPPLSRSASSPGPSAMTGGGTGATGAAPQRSATHGGDNEKGVAVEKLLAGALEADGERVTRALRDQIEAVLAAQDAIGRAHLSLEGVGAPPVEELDSPPDNEKTPAAVEDKAEVTHTEDIAKPAAAAAAATEAPSDKDTAVPPPKTKEAAKDPKEVERAEARQKAREKKAAAELNRRAAGVEDIMAKVSSLRVART